MYWLDSLVVMDKNQYDNNLFMSSHTKTKAPRGGLKHFVNSHPLVSDKGVPTKSVGPRKVNRSLSQITSSQVRPLPETRICPQTGIHIFTVSGHCRYCLQLVALCPLCVCHLRRSNHCSLNKHRPVCRELYQHCRINIWESESRGLWYGVWVCECDRVCVRHSVV